MKKVGKTVHNSVLIHFRTPQSSVIVCAKSPWKIRCLFQLRVNLSPLRSHKKRHNFSDTPFETCECNLGIEDNRHFLFECPFYAIQRVILAVNVIDILQRKNLNHLRNHPELYLYGHPSLDLIVNRQILLSTIKYVKDTMRFSTAVTQD